MRPGSFLRSTSGKLLLWTAPLAWLGCGGGGTDVVLPSLSVTTTTTGVELDADGYNLVVDGAQSQPIGVAATVTIERLTDGAHSVELTGLAPNCAAGDNPRTVTVQSGEVARVNYAVACSASSGTIEVATSISGPGSDPDGFALLLDGADRGSIGVSATTSLSGIPPGPHALGLTGLAANCQVAGENPRHVTVTAGETAQVPFAVTCAQPPPNTGSLRITTVTSGSPLDPDGYTVSVDGGNGQSIAVNDIRTLDGLAVGTRSIQLGGVATNCRVTGESRRSVAITQGQTAAVSFTITCAANTGSLTVTVSGLPAGTAAAVTVTGPNSFSRALTLSETLTGLALGSYTVSAASVTAGGSTYTASVDRPNVTVTAGGTATVTVSYSATSGSTLNLRIDGLYLTQSVQTRTGRVPLVRDRSALLRVFVVANQTNTASPAVRVRFFNNGALARTVTIPAPRSSTPTRIDEGEIGSSWNVQVDASLLRPEVSVLADVDPGSAIAESNESDNSFPASSTPQPLSVRSAPPAAIRFVPVLQTANGLQGTVVNPSRLMEQARRMYPLQSVQTDIHQVYTTTSGPLQPENDNKQWNQILSELEALRVTENSSRTYYGMVKLDYSSGIVGIGFVGTTSSSSTRAALGWDDPADAPRVVAHELGHTWGQLHTPCGDPPGIDPNYPYPDGNIGVYGYDVTSGTPEPPSASDIMGYCPDPWVSDYTYQRVLSFRQTQPAGTAAMAGAVQPCLLVWGHIENGRPVLEPAFHIMTRPVMPSAPGPYSVEATAEDGSSVFTLSFDAALVADDPKGSRHFAFAVPVNQARVARVGNLSLRAPGGVAAATAHGLQLQRAGRPDSVVAQRDAAGVALSWNAGVHPMIMVRDPETGEVLSFARGGKARISTPKPELDLELSDGLKSQRVRLAIKRR